MRTTDANILQEVNRAYSDALNENHGKRPKDLDFKKLVKDIFEKHGLDFENNRIYRTWYKTIFSLKGQLGNLSCFRKKVQENQKELNLKDSRRDSEKVSKKDSSWKSNSLFIKIPELIKKFGEIDIENRSDQKAADDPFGDKKDEIKKVIIYRIQKGTNETRHKIWILLSKINKGYAETFFTEAGVEHPQEELSLSA